MINFVLSSKFLVVKPPHKMSLSKERNIYKEASFQGHRSTQKLLQRKFFTKTNRPQVSDPYRIVNVKCHVPSPTTLSIRSQPKLRRHDNNRRATPAIMKRVETTPHGLKKDKCEWHNIIKKEREAIKKEWEQKTKLIRERQQMVKERYSPKKMKELYVNPNKDRMCKRSLTQASAPKTSKPQKAPQKSKLETAADEILSEAHKMIWFWLFNGLFPTNLKKHTENTTDV